MVVAVEDLSTVYEAWTLATPGTRYSGTAPFDNMDHIQAGHHKVQVGQCTVCKWCISLTVRLNTNRRHAIARCIE